MDIVIINHGAWTRYQPPLLNRPEGMPEGMSIMFCKNAEGVDWYYFQKTLTFLSIKMTVDSDFVVQAVYRDASMLFPQGCLVVEVQGDPVEDAFAKYHGMIYDPETNTFHPAPEPKSTIFNPPSVAKLRVTPSAEVTLELLAAAFKEFLGPPP